MRRRAELGEVAIFCERRLQCKEFDDVYIFREPYCSKVTDEKPDELWNLRDTENGGKKIEGG